MVQPRVVFPMQANRYNAAYVIVMGLYFNCYCGVEAMTVKSAVESMTVKNEVQIGVEPTVLEIVD